MWNPFKKQYKYIVTKEKIIALSPEIVKRGLQGMSEGQILDILSPIITQAYTSTGSTYIDKNNYPTYAKQIKAIYEMYNNTTSYGGEILRALIRTLVSFIGGEGMSVNAEKKATQKFVEKILNYNKLLEGTSLLKIITIGVMEGKCLLEVKPIIKEDKLNIKCIKYTNYITPYTVQEDNFDKEEYKSVTISASKKGKDGGTEVEEQKPDRTLQSDRFVYIKMGGSPDRVNNTPPVIANVLTDIENFSRAKYDMRKNNHLFGRVTPIFLVENLKEAKSLQNKINSMDSVIGKSYTGTAKQVFYLEPTGNAQKCLHEEMLELLRIIGTNISIPLHYLSYPDLLSNRATAENLLEMINAGTCQERLIIEEALTDFVKKAMVIATEKGMEGEVNDPDGFQLNLNFATLSLLKQVVEIWMPLAEAEYISRQSVMTLLPGIDVNKELKMLEKEKQERIDNMPTILKDGMASQQEEGQEEEQPEEKEGMIDNTKKK